MLVLSNAQPPETLTTHADGKTLDIVNVWLTLQGEGPFAGYPATFVRLAGCNLQCPTCDTDYTTGRKEITLDDLISRIYQASTGCPSLVVLTGGEPYRQTIGPLVDTLLQRSINVQIETNGSLSPQYLPYGHPKLTIVCSPKTPKLHPRFTHSFIDAFKYILHHEHVSDIDGLPTSVLGKFQTHPARPELLAFSGKIYIQPEDSPDPEIFRRNTEAAIYSCMKYGYILSVQLHKHLGLE